MSGRILLLLGLAAFAGPLAAQQHPWSLTPEIGWTHFSGNSRETSGPSGARSGGPGTTTSFGLRLGRDLAGFRLGLGLLYAAPGLSLADAQLEVIVRNTFTLIELAPEASLPLKRFGTGAVLRLHGGAALDLWSAEGESSHLIIGSVGAVSIELPVTAGTAMQVRYEGLVGGSIFSEGDLPTGFARRRMVRTRLGVGLRIGI